MLKTNKNNIKNQLYFLRFIKFTAYVLKNINLRDRLSLIDKNLDNFFYFRDLSLDLKKKKLLSFLFSLILQFLQNIFKKIFNFFKKFEDFVKRKIKEKRWDEMRFEGDKVDYKFVDSEEERLSKPKFKKWKFLNFSEQFLWSRLNSFWRAVAREFFFVRYDSLNIGENIETVETKDSFYYDSEGLALYTRMDVESSYDEDYDINFLLKHRPTSLESLSEEYYSVYTFFFIIFFLIFYCFNFTSLTWLFFGLIHSWEFETENEEDDPSNDMEEVTIRSVYNSGYELSGYYLQPYKKKFFSDEDYDFLYLHNLSLYGNGFFYNYFKNYKKSL